MWPQSCYVTQRGANDIIMNSLQSIIAITGSHSPVIFHLAQNGTKEASDTKGLGPIVAALTGAGI